MRRIKALELGTKRLLFTLSIVISFIAVFISAQNVNLSAFESIGVVKVTLYFMAFGIGSFIIFLIIVRLILWIVDGYK